MPTEREEVVCRPDLLNAQGAAPDACQALFDTATRSDVFDIVVPCDRGGRQRQPVELSVGCLRQPL